MENVRLHPVSMLNRITAYHFEQQDEELCSCTCQTIGGQLRSQARIEPVLHSQQLQRGEEPFAGYYHQRTLYLGEQ